MTVRLNDCDGSAGTNTAKGLSLREIAETTKRVSDLMKGVPPAFGRPEYRTPPTKSRPSGVNFWRVAHNTLRFVGCVRCRGSFAPSGCGELWRPSFPWLMPRANVLRPLPGLTCAHRLWSGSLLRAFCLQLSPFRSSRRGGTKGRATPVLPIPQPS